MRCTVAATSGRVGLEAVDTAPVRDSGRVAGGPVVGSGAWLDGEDQRSVDVAARLVPHGEV